MAPASILEYSLTQATLNWTAPSDDNKCIVISYQVDYRKTAATTTPVAAAVWEKVATTTATVFADAAAKPAVDAVPSPVKYVDKTARTAGAHYYRVQATNAAGADDTSGWSTEQAYHYAGVPGQVIITGGKASVSTATTITFAWTKPLDNGNTVTKYSVFHGLSAAAVTTEVALADVKTYTLTTTGQGYFYI